MFPHGRSRFRRGARAALLILALAALGACSGRQSALAPAGRDAAVLADLFWVMLVAAIVLWVALNGLFFFVTRMRPGRIDRRWGNAIVIGGGVLLPLVGVGALLIYGLSIMPEARADADGPRLHVTGEQWWWRVTYDTPAGPIVSANEIRLPAGKRAEILLDSKSVIHSFWVPALGGKMDMFPGRVNRLTLLPETPGVYRGQCAEFCGLSHAWMAFEAVVMEPEAYAAWLAHEAADALPPATEAARQGAAIFAREGCGACHAVRGTAARGRVGPDLTHVGARASLGAGRLGTSLEDYALWLGHTEGLKPGVEMPEYDHLPHDERLALAHYLKGLE